MPYGEALRHITKTVINELSRSGEQWDDKSRQDLVSTLFIAACKEKRIDFDLTEAA